MSYFTSLLRTCISAKRDILSTIETLAILTDKKTLKDVEEGLQDIQNGKIIGFEDFLRKHEYEK